MFQFAVVLRLAAGSASLNSDTGSLLQFEKLKGTQSNVQNKSASIVVDGVAGHSTGEDFEAKGIVYIKAATGSLYLHSYGGHKAGKLGTLHSCPKATDNPNCKWSFEPSIHSNTWYIKAFSSTPLYAHASGGAISGAQETLHSCSVLDNYQNCQWIMEPSPTRPHHYYIKVKDANLYLHAAGGVQEGNRITLHSCPKSRNFANCQWSFESACAEVKPTEDCRHWASLGKCADEEISNVCKVTCGHCKTENPVTVAHGEWKLIMSQTKGSVQYQIAQGITNEHGQAVTEEEANSIGASIGFRVMFSAGGPVASAEAEVSGEVRYDRSWSTASTISSSQAITDTKTAIASCPAPVGTRTKVFLYQWVIIVGTDVAHTTNTRCHYTEGEEHPPQCPFGACGADNEWCEAGKCLAWSK